MTKNTSTRLGLLRDSGLSAASLAGAAGCGGLTAYSSPVGLRVFGTSHADRRAKQHAAELARVAPPRRSGPSVQLTSGAMPRLSFASTADIPVEQLLKVGDRPLAMNGLCPPDMASIDDKFCVDKYEASLVEIMPDGDERAWPYYQPSRRPHGPRRQREGRLSAGLHQREAGHRSVRRARASALQAAGWKTACKGPEPKKFGYGERAHAGHLQRQRQEPGRHLLPGGVADGKAWTWDKMNDPQPEPDVRRPRRDRLARGLHQRLRRLRHGRQPPRVGRSIPPARSRAATTST